MGKLNRYGYIIREAVMKNDTTSRRVYFFSVISLVSFLLWLATPATPVTGESVVKDMQDKRQQLAQRPRRILFNDDGCHGPSRKTPEELISIRVKQVENTQVDTICYCTGGGGLFWGHQPEVGEVLGEFVDETCAQYVRDMRDGLIALKKLGTDPLAVVVDYAHQNNIEFFWSYRMNDPEDSYVNWDLSRRKRQHPKWLMGVKSDWDHTKQTEAKTWWALWDFSRPEVRDHILRIFEDVCQRYDIDGIELDFIRHPLYFRPNLDGHPAKPEHVAMMTDLVRRIRAMTEYEAARRGRPILVSARSPLSVESGLSIGLDVPTYLKEDLIDILIAGQDYVQMGVAASLKDMVDLGHQYQVPVYALIVPPKPYAVYSDNRAWRGAAMNRWYWGADGIYTFNLSPTAPDERFRHFGSVETLKGLDKIYGIDNPIAESVLGTFKLVMVAPNRLPITLTANNYVTAKLPVGEDIVANTPAGKTVSALLRLNISSLVHGDRITIKFNDHSLGAPNPVKPLTSTPQKARFALSVDPQHVKPGYNLIEVQLTTEQAAATAIDFLDLIVSYE